MKHAWLLPIALLAAAACASEKHEDPGEIIDGPWPSTPEPPVTPVGPQPELGETVSLGDAPPPISGGTLAVSADGIAVAADPDRDFIHVVDLTTRKSKTIALSPHDEPGRVAIDDAGIAHVVLRRGGKVASIDPTKGAVVTMREVCPAPRGIAVDAVRSRLLVACEDGALKALPLDPAGSVMTVADLGRDLRDVVVAGESLFVSRLRTAEVLRLDSAGTVVDRTQAGRSSVRMVGWRMVPPLADEPQSPPWLVYQVGSTKSVDVSQQSPNPYGGGEVDAGTSDEQEPLVMPAIEQGSQRFLLPRDVSLPVDLAVDADRVAVVAAGNGHTPGLPSVVIFARGKIPRAEVSLEPGATFGDSEPQTKLVPSGYAYLRTQAIAVALHGDELLVQSREPAALFVVSAQNPAGEKTKIDLGPPLSREDTGHAIFHSNTGRGLACASCHAEGGDDGRTWSFHRTEVTERRRTPSLRGTVAYTAPYHWSGDIPDIATLADEVMTRRMRGPQLDDGQKAALEAWTFRIPAPTPSPSADAAQIERGRSIFERSDVGCTKCHAGTMLTASGAYDVGTGGRFQIPSLVGVALRAPYLHDGRAKTLRQRFELDTTYEHGNTATLSDADLDDLIAYLESL